VELLKYFWLRIKKGSLWAPFFVANTVLYLYTVKNGRIRKLQAPESLGMLLQRVM